LHGERGTGKAAPVASELLSWNARDGKTPASAFERKRNFSLKGRGVLKKKTILLTPLHMDQRLGFKEGGCCFRTEKE